MASSKNPARFIDRPAVDYASIASALDESGVCVYPCFLSVEEVSACVADLESLRAAGAFKKAGTGAGRDQAAGNRRDETYWLDLPNANEVQRDLLAKIDELRKMLNQKLFLGLHDFEGHYAAYPPGGFYKRHLDTFRHDSRRTVSLVVYLNQQWSAADGGRLRIYGRGDSFTDIDPIGGTLVCFLSRESEHEVLTSTADRLSLAGWFKTRS